MLEKRRIRSFTVWLLPVVVLGGILFPILGYLVFFMMIFFLVLSYFKGRYWCGNICPRGAFLDMALSRVSLKAGLPDLLRKNWVKPALFLFFMSFFILQFVLAEKNVYSLGFVFVRMCLLTTLIAVVLGVSYHHRAWCIFCPMGFLQGKIGTLNRQRCSAGGMDDGFKKGKMKKA
jgi:ferredoxin-type protein NapH